MYSIKGDDIMIYSDVSSTDSRKATSPKLTLKDNTAGSLNITLSPGNAGYDKLERRTSEIAVYRDNKEIWFGRIITEKMDFWNNRVLTCEGELTYLNDTIQPQHKYEEGTTVREFLESVLNEHNKRYGDNERYKFHIGETRIYNADEPLSEIITDYETTLDCINKNIIEAFECHIRIERIDGKKYIGFVKEETQFNENTQTIRFGDNLLDFTKNWDLTDLATVIIPRGATLEKESDEDSDAFDTYVTLNDIPKDDVVDIEEIGEYVRDKNGKLAHDDDGNLIYEYNKKTDENGDLIYKYKKDADGYIVLEKDGENPIIRVNTKESNDDKIVVEFLEHHEDEKGNPINTVTSKIETDGTYASIYLKNENDEFYCLKDVYGWIEQVVDFNEAEDSIELLKKTRDYLKEHRFDQMTLEVSAVDMRYMMGNAEPIKILDRMRCISYPHGMNTLFTITELSIEIDKPDSAKYTLQKTLDYSPKQSSSLSGSLSVVSEELESPHSTILLRAKSDADKILREKTNGYVTLVTDTDGGRHSEALVISSGKDYKKSEHFWIWNVNGLGHYTEYGGEKPPTIDKDDETSKWLDDYMLNVGITMDGSIVANRITVGHMSADRVRTGVLMSQDGNVVWNLNGIDTYVEELSNIYPAGSMTIKKGSIALGDSFGKWDGAFCVDDSGNLHAEKGNIGGFTIESDNIHNDTMTLDGGGLHLTEERTDVGYIGASRWTEDTNKKILAMSLEHEASALVWGYRENTSDNGFTAKMVYAVDTYGQYNEINTLYIHGDLDLRNNRLTNFIIDPYDLEKNTIMDSFNGAMLLLQPGAIKEDGTINSSKTASVIIKNGFVLEN